MLSLAKLYASMALTVFIVTLISIIVLAGVVYIIGSSISLEFLLGFIAVVYVIQWLLSPYIVEAMYKIRPLEKGELPWLEKAVEELSIKSGIKKPQLMIAYIDMPNAFAYGSPLTGYRVAITRGLLKLLPKDEVIAVVGHELGHIKHRDILVMMLVGLIPTILLWLGDYLLRWGWLFGFRERDREGGLGPLAIIAVGGLLLILGFILNLGVLYLSRLREYYADAHSAFTVPNGSKKLMRALARILVATGYLRKKGVMIEKYSKLKTLFIASPDHSIYSLTYDIDSIIEEIKEIKPSIWSEIFSSHPHPSKRFRFLENLTLI